MRNYFHSIKFKISVSILSALLLGMFIAAVSNSGSSPLSTALSYITQPLSSFSSQIVKSVKNFNAGFVSSAFYKEEINSLQEEIQSYEAQLVDYEKTLKKLDSYEEFLEIKEDNPDFVFAPASVILRDTGDIYYSFTINKGSSDGLHVNDPVISGSDLVGVITQLNENSAVVETVLSPNVGISTYEIRTREDCYTENEAQYALDNLIKVSGLSRSTPVVAGGIVCTSGIGGKYPKDLIIGTVTQVKSGETDTSAYALVQPSVDFSQLIDVFVITDFEGKNG